MSENKIPEYTFIVPVYNANKSWLKRCLDSVLDQTVPDWELLIVDDGSTDDTPAYVDEYAKQDDRIYVIHKKNGRVASARNCGLDHARGKWIQFIDQDDYVSIDNLEKIAGSLDESLDYLMYNPVRHINGEEKEIIVRPFEDGAIINAEEHRQYIMDMLAAGYLSDKNRVGGFDAIWGQVYCGTEKIIPGKR